MVMSILLPAAVSVKRESANPAQQAATSAPILAYLFTLRRARHPLPHVWTNYFNGCPASANYRIHIHVDPTFNATSVEEKGPAAKYFNARRVLPYQELIKVHRFGFSLVQARMKLLRHALGDGAGGGPLPQYLSFFSESCAPIATCEAVHTRLLHAARASVPQSFVGEAPQTYFATWLKYNIDTPEWSKEFRETICPRCAAVGIEPKSFRFSPGWVTLHQAHAIE